ncbi:hypothetical protein PUN28_020065 [Cardiocondyla obscurior]|uniref:Uncharacterized protein n=1 Tax=Cardiocondyla obscurior TaxID=286306 RepID=A0AAW2EBP3_9HYME
MRHNLHVSSSSPMLYRSRKPSIKKMIIVYILILRSSYFKR